MLLSSGRFRSQAMEGGCCSIACFEVEDSGRRVGGCESLSEARLFWRTLNREGLRV